MKLTEGNFENKIDWDTVLDGMEYEMEYDIDFKDLNVFRTRCHNAAKARGLKIRTKTVGSNLIVQAYSGSEDPEPEESGPDRELVERFKQEKDEPNPQEDSKSRFSLFKKNV